MRMFWIAARNNGRLFDHASGTIMLRLLMNSHSDDGGMVLFHSFAGYFAIQRNTSHRLPCGFLMWRVVIYWNEARTPRWANRYR
jgi:hypothetical protein